MSQFSIVFTDLPKFFAELLSLAELLFVVALLFVAALLLAVAVALLLSDYW
jgi:hypothetical protein